MKRESSAGGVVLLCLVCVVGGFALAGKQFKKQSDALADKEWTISRLYELNGGLRKESINLYKRLKHEELVATNAKLKLESGGLRIASVRAPRIRSGHSRVPVIPASMPLTKPMAVSTIAASADMPLTEPIAASSVAFEPQIPVDESTKLAVQPDLAEFHWEQEAWKAERKRFEAENSAFLRQQEHDQQVLQEKLKAEFKQDQQRRSQTLQQDMLHRKHDLERELGQGTAQSEPR